jgi:hypothetical protein
MKMMGCSLAQTNNTHKKNEFTEDRKKLNLLKIGKVFHF